MQWIKRLQRDATVCVLYTKASSDITRCIVHLRLSMLIYFSLQQTTEAEWKTSLTKAQETKVSEIKTWITSVWIMSFHLWWKLVIKVNIVQTEGKWFVEIVLAAENQVMMTVITEKNPFISYDEHVSASLSHPYHPYNSSCPWRCVIFVCLVNKTSTTVHTVFHKKNKIKNTVHVTAVTKMCCFKQP